MQNTATWKDARATCNSLLSGADLVAIESEAEHEFVTNEIIKGGADFGVEIANVWTGCNDLYEAGSWVWASTDSRGRDNVAFHGEGVKCGSVDGEGVFHSWSNKGPKPSTDDKWGSCTNVFVCGNLAPTWVNVGCDEKRLYICEATHTTTSTTGTTTTTSVTTSTTTTSTTTTTATATTTTTSTTLTTTTATSMTKSYTSTTIATTSTTRTSTTKTTSVFDASAATAGGRLSMGAIVGIAVGAAVVLIAMAWYICTRSSSSSGGTAGSSSSSSNKSTMVVNGDAAGSNLEVHELATWPARSNSDTAADWREGGLRGSPYGPSLTLAGPGGGGADSSGSTAGEPFNGASMTAFGLARGGDTANLVHPHSPNASRHPTMSSSTGDPNHGYAEYEPDMPSTPTSLTSRISRAPSIAAVNLYGVPSTPTPLGSMAPGISPALLGNSIPASGIYDTALATNPGIVGVAPIRTAAPTTFTTSNSFYDAGVPRWIGAGVRQGSSSTTAAATAMYAELDEQWVWWESITSYR